jgi:hypothetical protein
MANVDKIDWGDFKAYLNKNEQWLAKKDIPVYMSSLIAFTSGQLEALANAEGMTGTASSSNRAATAAFADSNDNNNNRRQRLEQWGTQVAASINGDSANPQGPQGPSAPCTYCGRHHLLDQCRGVSNLIDDHKRRQLARRGGISKPSLHRGSSWRTNKPSQFSTRAYNGGGNGAADRGGRSGNSAAYRGRRGGGCNSAAGGHGHHGRRGLFLNRLYDEMELWGWDAVQNNRWARALKGSHRVGVRPILYLEEEEQENKRLSWATVTRSLRRLRTRITKVGGRRDQPMELE